MQSLKAWLTLYLTDTSKAVRDVIIIKRKIIAMEERVYEIDWEQRRYELAKAAMQGMTGHVSLHSKSFSEIANGAIHYADAVIEELKKDYSDGRI